MSTSFRRRWSDKQVVGPIDDLHIDELGIEAANLNHTYGQGYYDGCKSYQRKLLYSILAALFVGAAGGAWVGYGLAAVFGG